MGSNISANFPACATALDTPGAPVLRQGVLRRGWHRLPWCLMGTPGTPVWVVPHGGPGSGVSPALWAPFDLSHCQVLLWDQRGCGQARPRGGRAQCGWRHVVADMEALRRELDVAKWSLLGGSWGATVALAYVRAHPDRVDRLVLRGAFVWTAADMARVFGRQPVLHTWRQVFHFGDALAQRQTLLQWQWLERQAVLRGAQRSQRHGPTTAARAVLTGLQRAQRRTQAQRMGQLPVRPNPSLLAKAQVQMATLARRRGWSQRTVTEALNTLAQRHIRVDWVHGRWDAVCSPAPVASAHRRLPPGLSRWQAVDSGHLSVEPAMITALRAVLGGRQ